MKHTTRSKKALTPAQEQAKAERKAKFKALWQEVGKLSEADRAARFGSLPYVSVNGQAYSGGNMMLLALHGHADEFKAQANWD